MSSLILLEGTISQHPTKNDPYKLYLTKISGLRPTVIRVLQRGSYCNNSSDSSDLTTDLLSR